MSYRRNTRPKPRPQQQHMISTWVIPHLRNAPVVSRLLTDFSQLYENQLVNYQKTYDIFNKVTEMIAFPRPEALVFFRSAIRSSS